MPPGGHFLTELVLGNENDITLRVHTDWSSEPRAGKGLGRSRACMEGSPLQPPGQCGNCYFGFSKVFPGPMIAFQSLGISAEDYLSPCTCLDLTGQEDLNFTSPQHTPLHYARPTSPHLGKWTHNSGFFTQIQTHKLISTLDLLSSHL